MKARLFSAVYSFMLLTLFSTNSIFSQNCNDPFTVFNENVSQATIRHSQNTYIANRKEYFIYDDGTYSDYNSPTHQYKGTGGKAEAYMLLGYDNGPKRYKLANPSTSGGTYVDQFPAFSGPVFIKTSWSHAAYPNYACNAPYYAVIIQNCTGSNVNSGELKFLYKSAQASVSQTSGGVKKSFDKNPGWFTSNSYSETTTTNGAFNKQIKIAFTSLTVGERRAIYIPLQHNNLALNEIVETKAIVTFDGNNNPCSGQHDGGGATHISQVRATPHDPNNVEVIPSCLNLNSGPQVFENTRIMYTINFQNTGLGNAQNVKIVDFLSKHIDPATAIIVDSKHTVTDFYFQNNNAIIKFDGINLPGTQNPIVIAQNGVEKTKGWVKIAFCLKPIVENTFSSTYEPQCIENYAAIYFDTQPAVYTDRATTCESSQCILPPLEVAVLSALPSCAQAALRSKISNFAEISPNPFTNELNINDAMLSSNCNIEIVNLQGQKVLTQKTQGNDNNNIIINTETIPPGLYIITLNNGSEKKTMKVYRN